LVIMMFIGQYIKGISGVFSSNIKLKFDKYSHYCLKMFITM